MTQSEAHFLRLYINIFHYSYFFRKSLAAINIQSLIKIYNERKKYLQIQNSTLFFQNSKNYYL